MAKEKSTPRKAASSKPKAKPNDKPETIAEGTSLPASEPRQPAPTGTAAAAPPPQSQSPIVIAPNITVSPQFTNTNETRTDSSARSDTSAINETKTETRATSKSTSESGKEENFLKKLLDFLVEHKGPTILLTIVGALGGGAWFKFGHAHEEKNAEAVQPGKKPELSGIRYADMPKPAPRTYKGSMATYFASRQQAGNRETSGRRAFNDKHEGLLVNWTGYVGKEYADGAYSVSVEKTGGSEVMIQFKEGEFRPFITKGTKISFEGMLHGDLPGPDDRVSVEDARLVGEY